MTTPPHLGPPPVRPSAIPENARPIPDGTVLCETHRRWATHVVDEYGWTHDGQRTSAYFCPGINDPDSYDSYDSYTSCRAGFHPLLTLPEAVEAPPPLIEGVLRRRDRLMVVAFEGVGKSTLLRQIAMQAAAGIHPWTEERPPPVRTLLVDLENDPGDVEAALDAMLTPRPEALRVVARPLRLDLTVDGRDVKAVETLLDVHDPSLLVIGPVYRMMPVDDTEGSDRNAIVRRLCTTLDRWRRDHDVAVMLEDHAPLGAPGGRRELRPFGASEWLRWLEYGIALHKNGTVGRFREDRVPTAWPAKLERGGHPWPWTKAADPGQERRAKMLAHVEQVGMVSKSKLAEHVGGKRTAVLAEIDAMVEEGLLRRQVDGQTHFVTLA